MPASQSEGVGNLNTETKTQTAKSWLVCATGLGEAGFNMAMDEALLEAMPRLQKPVLRFYGWTERASSFGYFQKYAEIERTTLLRPLVRRPTGGGLVPHDADWTYSVAFPTTCEWYGTSAIESYRRMHEWVRAAFAELQVATELAACCQTAGPGQCFVGYEKFDVLWHGKKIAGAAQRRSKSGLLIQGSVQPPPLNLKREEWERAMRTAGAKQFGGEWSEEKPDAELISRVGELVREKYSQPSYHEKR